MHVPEMAASARRRGWLRRAGICALVVGVAVSLFVWWKAAQDRTAARRLIDRGRWSEARGKLSWLLTILPQDSALNLMMAEAYALDDSQRGNDQVRLALLYLERVSDESPEGATARVHQARLCFLLEHQPQKALELVQRALRQDPESTEAHSLHWRILDLTGREEQAEPVFRRLYDLGPATARLSYLRDWYLSQNDPAVITAGFDQQMGFRSRPDEPGRQVELHRLLEFRHREPHRPENHAATAQWFLLEGDPEQALHVLREADRLEGARQNPFFVSVQVNVLLEVGRLDQAASLVENWPEPRTGYSYWRSRGLLEEELHRNYALAAEAYAKAATFWPGQTDWRTQFRQASCLSLAGDKTAADSVRQHAQAVQELFRPEMQTRLRRALESPHVAENLDVLIEFYRVLKRPDEVEYWSETVSQTQST